MKDWGIEGKKSWRRIQTSIIPLIDYFCQHQPYLTKQPINKQQFHKTNEKVPKRCFLSTSKRQRASNSLSAYLLHFIPFIHSYTNFFNSLCTCCNCLLIRNRFEKETDLKCNDCLNNKNWFAISKEWGIACWRCSFFLCIWIEYCWNWSSFRWWIEWRNNLYQIEKRQILE